CVRCEYCTRRGGAFAGGLVRIDGRNSTQHRASRFRAPAAEKHRGRRPPFRSQDAQRTECEPGSKADARARAMVALHQAMAGREIKNAAGQLRSLQNPAKTPRGCRRGDSMIAGMTRRDFITLLGGAAAAWPLAARAQQSAIPVIGLLISGSREPLRQQISAIHARLKESGYVEGQNVSVEYRFAEGQFDRFPTLAAELVRRSVTVLVTSSNAGALAAKKATATIPIVFSVGDDPVVTGLVASLNRPGGNMTGVYQFTVGLEAKRLGLLHELVPKSATIAVLGHPRFPPAGSQLEDVQEAARRLGVQLVGLP